MMVAEPHAIMVMVALLFLLDGVVPLAVSLASKFMLVRCAQGARACGLVCMCRSNRFDPPLHAAYFTAIYTATHPQNNTRPTSFSTSTATCCRRRGLTLP